MLQSLLKAASHSRKSHHQWRFSPSNNSRASLLTKCECPAQLVSTERCQNLTLQSSTCKACILPLNSLCYLKGGARNWFFQGKYLPAPLWVLLLAALSPCFQLLGALPNLIKITSSLKKISYSLEYLTKLYQNAPKRQQTVTSGGS